jgi:hypothetical protein
MASQVTRDLAIVFWDPDRLSFGILQLRTADRSDRIVSR